MMSVEQVNRSRREVSKVAEALRTYSDSLHGGEVFPSFDLFGKR